MRLRLFACVVLLLIAATSACSSTPEATKLTELQRAKSGPLEVVLLSKADAIKEGKDDVVLEFRTGNDNHLVDVGTVKVNASMVMAGMGPMLGSATVANGNVPGRYVVTTDLTMSGTWRLAVEWGGPAGKGSVNLPGTVR